MPILITYSFDFRMPDRAARIGARYDTTAGALSFYRSGLVGNRRRGGTIVAAARTAAAGGAARSRQATAGANGAARGGRHRAHGKVTPMIDLHAHTSCSDGTLAPADLVALAKRIGLSAIAITDHDTVDGLEEGLAAGMQLGIEVVPGVEINLEHEQVTLDLLGYFLAGAPSDELREQLARLRAYRDERNARILARLAELGYPVEPAELAAIAAGEAVGRPHIGEAMRRRGYVASISEAFERFLRRSAPAYVDRRRLGLAEGVRLLGESGGVAVIAHPGIIRTDDAGLRRLCAAAAQVGVIGFECYYSSYDAAQVDRCLRLAHDFGFVATGGSDFHGDTKPDVRLGSGPGGAPIADHVLTQLRRAAGERA
jgi:predicted metal-dependent phosphoesterase TrpH